MLFNIICLPICSGEIIDRVVAYVDDQAITIKDFLEFRAKIKEKLPNISSNEIIELMINRKLLLKESKKIFLEGDEEEAIKNYIDLKIKSKIFITDDKIREYYEQNKHQFGEKPFLSIRDEIETYLFERELNTKLIEHIKELRELAEIKIIFLPFGDY